jgi:hypothetical protein
MRVFNLLVCGFAIVYLLGGWEWCVCEGFVGDVRELILF